MADIRPMINELKGKIPSKDKVLQMISDLNLQIDTKKIKTKADEIQGQLLSVAIETAKNPKIQLYAKNVLSAEMTNKAILKLKETLPNQSILDQLDKMRMAYIKPANEVKTEEKEETKKAAAPKIKIVKEVPVATKTVTEKEESEEV